MSNVSCKEQYGVVPFDGTNFAIWNRRVLAIFCAKDLDEFLEKEPDATKETEISKSKKAYALLLTLLSDRILCSLQTEKSSCQIWKKLVSTYEAKGAVNQILSRKRLATIKKSKEVPMRQHIDTVLKLITDLRISGAEVSDIDTIVYILMSLPKEFENVKVALENQPNANLTLEFVTQRLLDAEALMCDSKHDSVKFPADSAAFAVAPKKFFCNICKRKGHTSKFCKMKTVSCYNCGKTGHFKRDCKLIKSQSNSSDNKQLAQSALSFAIGDLNNNKFIIDSGATSHMCSRREWFSDFKPFSGTVACASKKDRLNIVGTGTIPGTLQGREVTLKNVLFVPDLNGELISVKCIQNAGYSVLFKDDKTVVKKGNDSFIIANLNDKGQYVSNLSPIRASAHIVNNDANLWHRRMGHSSNKVLQEMGLPTSEVFCEECVTAKQTNEPVGKGPRQRENSPMKVIHTDICGPIDPPTCNGERYFMTIIDDYSRFSEVHLLKHKSDIVEILKLFFKQNPEIYKIRCDNAKEYVTGELRNCCKKAGILIDPAPPYTPFLNGVAERANRYILEKARALIFEAKLPKSFWGYAAQTAAYLKNRMPSQSLENCIPFKLKYGRSPDLDVIKVFGCDAYMRIPDTRRKKLDPKSEKMTFIGYSSMGYRLLDPTTKRVVISRNVKFNEEKKVCVADSSDDNTDPDSENDVVETNETETSTETNVENTRPKRDTKLPSKLDDFYVYEAFTASLSTITFEDIEKLPKDEQTSWKEAMDDEMQCIEQNGVWELQKLPPDKSSISCKWVLRKKRDGKYKARLCARGFMQKEGVDYTDTFSPVISMTALRFVLVIMLNENYNVFVLDVKTAFLNGDLNEVIFMDQPQGYDDNSGRKCKLKKSLYGLKQAPRQWFKKFLDFVVKLGFKQLDSEPCIFTRHVNAKKIIMALYVDDLLIAGSNVNEIHVIISVLSEQFQMSKLEKASEFLGIRLEFTPDALLLDQESYILRLLEKFNMSDCKPSATPIEPKSTTADFEKGTVFHGPYRELIGSLLYLAYITRPDILFAINCLSQLQEHPTDVAWCALKKILRYLKGTSKLKLEYKKGNLAVSELSMYVDADWGSNPNDRKSVSGYIIMFCNCPILWCCNKQKCIALSSTEAEIIALGKGIQDVLWIKSIVCEIANVKSLVVFEDNQSCIKCITNENSFGRLKHIDVKLKFIRNAVSSNNIKIEYISSGFQVADMLTKSLPKTKLYELMPLCCLKFES